MPVLDPKDIVTIYTAVVATIVAVWNIYAFYANRMGRVRIFINPNNQNFTDEDYGKALSKIEVSIVNLSDKTRLINKVILATVSLKGEGPIKKTRTKAYAVVKAGGRIGAK